MREQKPESFIRDSSTIEKNERLLSGGGQTKSRLLEPISNVLVTGANRAHAWSRCGSIVQSSAALAKGMATGIVMATGMVMVTFFTYGSQGSGVVPIETSSM